MWRRPGKCAKPCWCQARILVVIFHSTTYNKYSSAGSTFMVYSLICWWLFLIHIYRVLFFSFTISFRTPWMYLIYLIVSLCTVLNFITVHKIYWIFFFSYASMSSDSLWKKCLHGRAVLYREVFASLTIRLTIHVLSSLPFPPCTGCDRHGDTEKEGRYIKSWKGKGKEKWMGVHWTKREIVRALLRKVKKMPLTVTSRERGEKKEKKG